MFLVCPKCGDTNDINIRLTPGDQVSCFTCGYMITKK